MKVLISLSLIPIVLLVNVLTDDALPPPCPSEIYCHGRLLDTVQMARIYNDSKTFVDMKLRKSPDETLKIFDEFMLKYSPDKPPTKDEIHAWVEENFEETGREFENWMPSDFRKDPEILNRINDKELRAFAQDLNGIWNELGRKMRKDVSDNQDLYSIIYVENGVIVPGGRFREFYYWDSYWIVKGLLLSEMTNTTQGMLKNFLSIVDRFGFIPNGGRIYYSMRSQPPLLTPMVKAYVDHTDDKEFAISAVDTLANEFEYWMANHTVTVKGHRMARYGDKSSGPRPESYREDIETGKDFPNEADREDHYSELKAAAESGMDFSSRWFINDEGTNIGDLTHLKTRSIVPVELNAILFWNAQIIAEFYGYKGNTARQEEFLQKAQELKAAVDDVLWNEEVGAWLDYDMINNKSRNYFVPTNLSPLWTKCYNESDSQHIADRIVNYINITKLDDYPGGVPTTMMHSGEQWDWPNVWAPTQHMMIVGLDNLGDDRTKRIAQDWAQRWVLGNYLAYKDTGAMFEKYLATELGGHGGGGEYEVQKGFGWTNGALFDLFDRYGSTLSTSSENDALPEPCTSEIYCHGRLLDTVQMARIYNDSKTFVDMKLRKSPDETLRIFDEFMLKFSADKPPTTDEIRAWVEENFEGTGSEFENWVPSDFRKDPEILNRINDKELRAFAQDLNGIWNELGRKMRKDVFDNQDLYSIIYVENGVIVPGGRFREFYYWDSYWIVKGLLLSEMTNTTQGMLKNFLSVIDRVGFIPNGGRIYYLMRSHPPLLSPMIKAYVDHTGDKEFAISAVETLANEFEYWMTNHTVTVKGHRMAKYGGNGKSTGPRPESYREDVETGRDFPNEADREEHYKELIAAAESGWDFSSRWFINNEGTNIGDLKHTKTRSIIPVELNAILFWNAQIIAEFYGYKGNTTRQEEFLRKAQEFKAAVDDVLWNEEVGVWLDYDMINNKSRNYFAPTNLSPLWTKCYNESDSKRIADRIVNYINITKLDDYPGGVPATMMHSGEQWDWPNVWAPLQHIMIVGLDNLGDDRTKRIAQDWAQRWVLGNYLAYKDTGAMYEKYLATELGGHGGGGEYENQKGFGWTNGALFDLFDRYGSTLSTSSGKLSPLTIMTGILAVVTTFISRMSG